MSRSPHFSSRTFTRLSTPLLVALLAACGNGADSGTDTTATASPRQAKADASDAADNRASNNDAASSDPEKPGGPNTQPGNAPASTPASANPQAPTTNIANAGNTPTPGQNLNDPGCKVQYTWQDPAPQQPGPDPLLPEQWYLHNTGTMPGSKAGEDINVRGAWESVKGDGVRIAVVDSSLDILHEDLAANVVPGGSHNYQPWANGNAFPLPCSGDDFVLNHGTRAAGIIAARGDNALGISGVAPRASLVGLNVMHTGTVNASHVRDAFARDLDRNHILNSSWSADTDRAFDGPPGIGLADYQKLIQNALDNGRQGLGNIFVFAAGNDGHCRQQEGSCVRLLATYDAYLNHQGVVAVCATDITGKRSAYSTPGANLLVCAPSSNQNLPGIRTTSIQNQYGDFGGTSAAAPMVSGVVALMLEANPRLTWRDVRLVLARTARKVDPDNPGWTSHNGLNYHHAYGFGVVDATRAVEMARSWQSVGGSKEQKRCGPYTSNAASGAIPIKAADESVDVLHTTHPTDGYLNSDLEVPADCDIRQIEHVEVKANALPAAGQAQESLDAGLLQIMLTSPSGQRSVLATPHECIYSSYNPSRGQTVHPGPCTGLQDNVIGVTRHMGEPAATPTNRTWTLSIANRGGSRAGNAAGAYLQDWSLTSYGR